MSQIKLIYEFVDGLGDTVTCDGCSRIIHIWYTDGIHAVCKRCRGKR